MQQLYYRLRSILPWVLLYLGTTAAANFDQCIAEIRSGAWGTIGGTDNHGKPITNISQANAITYGLCIRACGADPEAFDWPSFYQQFSSWLLPYFALLSQLPFGAESRLSNLTSVFLTVGSPALAAYSLALTALNGRWVSRRFRGIAYPNADHAASVLSNLQSTPITTSFEDELLPSLVVLHHNDEWWKELAEGLTNSNTWSVAAVTSMGWVVIAYVLTIIDSFTTPHTDDANAQPFRALGILNLFGKGAGFVWLWLVPIVYGWIQVSPICDAGRVRRLLKRIDMYAHRAEPDGAPKEVSTMSSRRGISVASFPDYISSGVITASALTDRTLCAPIFNYARLFSWSAAIEDVASVFAVAAAKAHARQPVSSESSWKPHGKHIHEENRAGTRQEVHEYCGATPTRSSRERRRGLLMAYERMLVASLVGLSLQWGTSGAAMLVVYFAPTIGLGCESGAFLLYSSVATVVWLLMVFSSIFAHHAYPDAHRSDIGPTARARPRPLKFLATLAVFFRRLAKLLAALNTVWIVFANLAQFSNFFDRCWCNSCVLSLGRSRAYDVIHAIAEDVASMKTGWIGGIVLGTGSAIFFIVFIHLLLDKDKAHH